MHCRRLAQLVISCLVSYGISLDVFAAVDYCVSKTSQLEIDVCLSFERDGDRLYKQRSNKSADIQAVPLALTQSILAIMETRSLNHLKTILGLDFCLERRSTRHDLSRGLSSFYTKINLAGTTETDACD
jgi:hypothetical protein